MRVLHYKVLSFIVIGDFTRKSKEGCVLIDFFSLNPSDSVLVYIIVKPYKINFELTIT